MENTEMNKNLPEKVDNISETNVQPTVETTKEKRNIVVTITGEREIIQREAIHQKFVDANVEMLATGNLPYYGEFNLFLNFHEANIGTCGVNVSSKGMNFYWDRSFVDSLEQKEANFILIHEDFHLLFDHIKRTIGYEQKLSNIAQDMIINQIIYDDVMKSSSLKGFLQIPISHDEFIKFPDGNYLMDEKGNKVKNPHYGKNTAMFVPKEYKGNLIFEELYEWLLKKYNDYKNRQGQGQGQKQQGQGQGQKQQGQGQQQKGQGQPQQGQGQGEGQDGEQGQNSQQGQGQGEGSQDKNNKSNQKQKGGCGEKGDEPDYGDYGQNGTEMSHLDKIFENLEQSKGQTLDVHLGDEIPEELRKEIVKDIIENLKSRGLESGEMQTILNKLRKSKKDYLKEIKRAIAQDIFGTSKSKTITRPHRRGVDGLKGHRKFKNKINCLLDTSGSMGGEFEKVLSYIFQNDVEINLIQVDTKIQSVNIIKNKKDLEKMKINGLGGTELQPGLDMISDKKNKLDVYNTVILTDGYTDSLNFSGIKGKTLILTTANKCPLTHDNGRVKQIIIDKEKN
jgi:predicted metal-dependent peptidase